jgi:ribosomal protein S18 acetylase RimI-like enzyme
MTDSATIRSPEPGDRRALAALSAEAWRYAYRGIIPGLTLERMIARRGPARWAATGGPGYRMLVMEFGGRIVGYAQFGPCRIGGTPRMGEISELYVTPECHGAGFGRALFDAARRRLSAGGLNGLLIWALAENDLACGFYRAVGGKPRFHTVERLGGVALEKIGFHWARGA